MSRFVIGVDFGTLAARALLVDAASGAEVAEASAPYSHGILDSAFFDGQPLPPLYAIQHPADYPEALSRIVHELLSSAGIPPSEVAGIGVDFTSCTILPVDEKGIPLCQKPFFEREKHAYVKLWKHHAAVREAEEIEARAIESCEPWLGNYGGKISCEGMLPKILQILREAPDIYYAAARFIEAGDWITWMLTGNETHSASYAAYKALWDPENGYPSDTFLSSLDTRLAGRCGGRLSNVILPVGASAGRLSSYGAELTGLSKGTPVSVPQIDAHAGMAALNITGEGGMLMIVGTSACHIINSKIGNPIPGICGVVRDGVMPGLYTYEAGQAGFGDIFEWFVRTGVPVSYDEEARGRGIDIHTLLCEKASRLCPGESHIIALDWLNGNRSTLVDPGLSGALFGMTLSTRPEEIYRAWIESVAYGTRRIIEQFEEYGVPVKTVCAAGGIAKKNPMLMQICSDVTGLPIRVAATSQAGALGSAVYAAVACGLFSSVADASACFAKPPVRVYEPIPENRRIYDELYAEYRRLYDLFGRGGDPLMKNLNRIRDGKEPQITR